MLEDMEQIYEWSICEVPDVQLGTFSTHPAAELVETIKHGWMRTFASTAFTMFARNSEMCNLGRGDIAFGFRTNGPAPRPYFTIRLSERKGWQKKAAVDKDTIQWWGGWIASAVEAPDTLVKYLVNALHRQETTYPDALNPDAMRRPSLLNRNRCKALPAPEDTSSTFQAMKEELKRSIAQQFDEFKGALRECNNTMVGSLLSSFLLQLVDAVQLPHSSFSTSGHTSGFTSPPSQPPTFRSYAPSTAQVLALSSPPQTPGPSPSRNSDLSFTTHQPGNSSQEVPVAGLVIPDLRRGALAWKDAVEQWEQGGKGLARPLKDWPKVWYTGGMKNLFGSKRSQRRLIAEAYARCGSDDDEFMRTYPAASKGVTHLLEQIRARNPDLCLRRASKNGLPGQRNT
ncbi:hypothetical protein CC1G_11623 [Coprinopsis cinerea okayama7|uniref:Uncharacterized protein n=1 Tax=Coprinopsis cinerea (strain Okayama-7 / 130 / ATCC MYA-4618 / FGSC 9003) TaxID=240176 RepID=A8PCT3_COPC7|nr:hypothetical protein CC1G_11623 [Coprinopsis cinerea okayama7\|eukprot:XP_001840466.2 hypothetical protein CC1G_11623 [Coprinopsis cinerea okayama7\